MAEQIRSIKSGVSSQDAYEQFDIDCRNVNTSEPLIDALHSLYNEVLYKNNALKELNVSLKKNMVTRDKEIIKLNNQVKNVSFTDALTSLPNRRYALFSLNHLWDDTESNATLLTCIMVDIDDFKGLNHAYGYEVGDDILCKFARYLQQNVPQNGVMCRFYADKFLLICPNLSKDNALRLAHVIQHEFSTLDSHIDKGSVSIGIVSREHYTGSAESLLHDCENTLCKAKSDASSGINVYAG